jgi:hypothetical protein
MAIKIAIVGEENTGKSMSRAFLNKPEECFVLAPSNKNIYLRDKKTKKTLPRLSVEDNQGRDLRQIIESLGGPDEALTLMSRNEEVYKTSGNHLWVRNISHVAGFLRFISAKMPNIKLIIIPDFTHYLSHIMASKAFIRRKSGGEAFQRFWELAADALNNIVEVIDELREDLVIVTEYHSQYNEVLDKFEVFVPGGQMLNDKFKIASYYDYIFETHIEVNEDKSVNADGYKFVTRKWDKYQLARSGDMFLGESEKFIPNNLQLIIDKL